MDEQELQQAVRLLVSEFPDLSESHIAAALRELDLDIPAARRRLLQLASAASSARAGPQGGGSSAAAAAGTTPADGGDDDSWFDWNKGLRDLGLESFSAQLSLLGRQVASTLNDILPADLNPFAYDEEELEEEERLAAAKAAQDAEREKNSKAVGGATARQLAARRGGPGSRSPGSSRFPSTEEEGEEEDYDKLN
ncbi:antibiotic ABC transporter ATP-binding [Micractinium conductrix]|uniref:Antibiotic ABC transporter ATP-binding n=1 Tax=Micractinium conductrix TaxID=554055 RepID=A0A2P6VBP6_9CHLO|nr:antibiotic ABC transporter ATP-binding [Micractinium conductrix]|eukprot:PSC71509.1 antibiotic ABC transporter ATP-binding [Micractinium conductrix]